MQRIPFADFVLNEVARGRARHGWGFDCEYRFRDTMADGESPFPNDATDRDDWQLFFESRWFGMVHQARILRGPERYAIIARGSQWKALRDELRKQHRAGLRAREISAEIRRKKELDAAWWP